MPMGHLVLAELPAEVDLAALDHGGEVDQAAVDVTEDDSGILERAEQPSHLEEGGADPVPRLASAVAGERRRRAAGGPPRR